MPQGLDSPNFRILKANRARVAALPPMQQMALLDTAWRAYVQPTLAKTNANLDEDELNEVKANWIRGFLTGKTAPVTSFLKGKKLSPSFLETLNKALPIQQPAAGVYRGAENMVRLAGSSRPGLENPLHGVTTRLANKLGEIAGVHEQAGAGFQAEHPFLGDVAKIAGQALPSVPLGEAIGGTGALSAGLRAAADAPAFSSTPGELAKNAAIFGVGGAALSKLGEFSKGILGRRSRGASGVAPLPTEAAATGPSVPFGGSAPSTGGIPASPTGMPEGSAFGKGAPVIEMPKKVRTPRVAKAAAKAAKPKEKIIPDLTPDEVKAIADAHPDLGKALSTAKQVEAKIKGPVPPVKKLPPSGTVRIGTEGAGGTRREVGKTLKNFLKQESGSVPAPKASMSEKGFMSGGSANKAVTAISQTLIEGGSEKEAIANAKRFLSSEHLKLMENDLPSLASDAKGIISKIKESSAYEGKLYRGLHFSKSEMGGTNFKTLDNLKPGDMYHIRRLAAFSKSPNIPTSGGFLGGDYPILLETSGPIKASDLTEVSNNPEEKETLSFGKFKVKQVESLGKGKKIILEQISL